jgi:hypothetical protein
MTTNHVTDGAIPHETQYRYMILSLSSRAQAVRSAFAYGARRQGWRGNGQPLPDRAGY